MLLPTRSWHPSIWAFRVRSRWSTRPRCVSRSAWGSPSDARSPRRAASPGRTTSTPTSARTTRSRSTTSPSPSRGRSRSSWPTGRSSRCPSSGRTWKRMPASSRTSAAPPAVSRGRSTRSWTTTAPVCLSWKSSRSRSSGPNIGHPSWPPRTCARFVTWCSRSASRRRAWSAAISDATRMCLCGRAGRRSSERAPRPRTSTRCVPSSAPCATRSSVKQPSSPRAGRSRRRRGTGTKTPGPRRRVDPSRMPTTTATSRSPIFFPSRRRRSSSNRCAPRCRSRPPRVGAASRPSGASPTSISRES